MKRLHKLLALLVCLLVCACGSESPRGQGGTGGSGTPSLSPAQQLLGLWVEPSAEVVAEDYRLSIRFRTAPENTNTLNFSVSLIAPDGSSLSAYDGTATLSEGRLRLTFNLTELLEPMEAPYTLTATDFRFEDLHFVKSSNDQIPTLTGNGSLRGTIRISEAVPQNQAAFVPGEFFVTLKDEGPSSSLAGLHLQNELKSVLPGIATLYRKDDVTDMAALSSTSLKSRLIEVDELQKWTLDRIHELQSDPRIANVQPNYRYHTTAQPNDARYSLQWHYRMIGLPEAWDITTGSDDVIVAIVDTGARFDHADLSGRLLPGFDFIENTQISGDGNGRDGDATDIGDGQGSSRPSSWHGSHVAGTIGALTNNNLGVAGVTWRTRLLPLRALGVGSVGSTNDIANAILYAAGLSNSSGFIPREKARVINLSLGGSYPDLVMDQAIARAIEAGVIVVAAAGNNNSTQLGSPASSPGVITVGAVGPDGNKAPYSNYGPRIDIVAPGGNTGLDMDGNQLGDGVLSTSWNESEAAASYNFLQGTSMAAPHVTGVIALMLAVNPDLTPEQVRQILTSTATDLGSAGRDDTYGYGLIHAARAVNAARNRSALPPGLHLTQNFVEFSSQATTRTVLVQNSGDGVINNLVAHASTQSGGNWLSVSLSRLEAPATLTLTARPENLSPGDYQGAVSVLSSSGSRTISVRLTIRPPTTTDEIVHLLLINGRTSQVEQTLVTRRSQNYAYAFDQLPVGLYFLIAGTDHDQDDEFCEVGDLCGGYLTWEDPLPVFVLPNRTQQADFTIAPLTAGIQ